MHFTGFALSTLGPCPSSQASIRLILQAPWSVRPTGKRGYYPKGFLSPLLGNTGGFRRVRQMRSKHNLFGTSDMVINFNNKLSV